MKQSERQSGRERGYQIENKKECTLRDSAGDKVTNKAETQQVADKLGVTLRHKLKGKVGKKAAEKAGGKIGDKVADTRGYTAGNKA